MKNHFQQKISITKLRVNPDNVRFDESVANQIEAMRAIIIDQKRKFINLSKHIAENGIEPGRAVYVTPISNTSNFLVLDGNRRVTALKLMSSRELRDEFQELLPINFNKISEHFKNNNYVTKIECIVYPLEEDSREWIKVNHGFAADGVSTQDWDSAVRGRVMAAYSNSRLDRDIIVLNYLKESPLVSNELKEKIRSTKRKNNTTLRRILSDDVLPEIGITFTKSDVKFLVEESEAVKPLVRFVKDLLYNKKSARAVFDTELRAKYISELKESGDLPDLTKLNKSDEGIEKSEVQNNNQTEGNFSENTDNDQENNYKKTVSKKPKPIKNNREVIFKKSFLINDSDARITDIYNELCALSVEKYPNAVAILTRAFVEMMVKEYGKKYKVEGIGKEVALRDAVNKVVDHLRGRFSIDEDDVRGLVEACDKKNISSMFSIESFQQLVHREKLKPIPSELIQRWDNIEPAIKHIIENI